MRRSTRIATDDRIGDLLNLAPRSLECSYASIIRAHHEVCGYKRLADILWLLRLTEFVKTDDRFGAVLYQATRVRSARESTRCLVALATTIMSLESLVTNIGNCNSVYPEATAKALAFFDRGKIERCAPLTSYYLAMARQAVTLATVPRADLARGAAAFVGPR